MALRAMRSASSNWSMPLYSARWGSKPRYPPPTTPGAAIASPKPVGGLKPSCKSKGPILPGEKVVSTASPNPSMTKVMGPSWPVIPAPIASVTAVDRSAGARSCTEMVSTVIGPRRRSVFNTVSNPPLPRKCKPFRRDHSMPNGNSTRLSPLPSKELRNESPSPAARTSAHFFS